MRQFFRLAAALVVAAVPFAPAERAGALTPRYVAIVISSPGGTAAACIRFTGASGAAVLGGAVNGAVVYRRDGVIVQINGYPASATADDTHYWSYWHDSGSSWQYSNVGPNGYTPAAGTVEGWSYDNGAADPSPPPRAAAGLYGALCGARDRPPVPTSSAPRPPVPSKHRTSTAPRTTRHSTTPAASRPARTTTAAPASGPAAPTPKRARRHASPSRTPASPGAIAVSIPRGSGSAAPTVISASPAAVHRPDDGGSVWPTVAVAGLVAALAAAGAWAAVRRRGAG